MVGNHYNIFELNISNLIFSAEVVATIDGDNLPPKAAPNFETQTEHNLTRSHNASTQALKFQSLHRAKPPISKIFRKQYSPCPLSDMARSSRTNKRRIDSGLQGENARMLKKEIAEHRAAAHTAPQVGFHASLLIYTAANAEHLQNCCINYARCHATRYQHHTSVDRNNQFHYSFIYSLYSASITQSLSS